MSEGPINQDRKARKQNPYSTVADKSTHMAGDRPGQGTRCGTKQGRVMTEWRFVNCTNCRAAGRADGEDVPQ
jgi:hypothetical protein